MKNRRAGCPVPRDRVRRHERVIRLVSRYRIGRRKSRQRRKHIFFDPVSLFRARASIFHPPLIERGARLLTSAATSSSSPPSEIRSIDGGSDTQRVNSELFFSPPDVSPRLQSRGQASANSRTPPPDVYSRTALGILRAFAKPFAVRLSRSPPPPCSRPSLSRRRDAVQTHLSTTGKHGS